MDTEEQVFQYDYNARFNQRPVNMPALKAGLQQLKSKITVIRELRQDIEELIGIGVSYFDIASCLKQRGVEYNENSLKIALAQIRKDEVKVPCPHCGQPITERPSAVDTAPNA